MVTMGKPQNNSTGYAYPNKFFSDPHLDRRNLVVDLTEQEWAKKWYAVSSTGSLSIGCPNLRFCRAKLAISHGNQEIRSWYKTVNIFT